MRSQGRGAAPQGRVDGVDDRLPWRRWGRRVGPIPAGATRWAPLRRWGPRSRCRARSRRGPSRRSEHVDGGHRTVPQRAPGAPLCPRTTTPEAGTAAWSTVPSANCTSTVAAPWPTWASTQVAGAPSALPISPTCTSTSAPVAPLNSGSETVPTAATSETSRVSCVVVRHPGSCRLHRLHPGRPQSPGRRWSPADRGPRTGRRTDVVAGTGANRPEPPNRPAAPERAVPTTAVPEGRHHGTGGRHRRGLVEHS